jgi:hypothetical protein
MSVYQGVRMSQHRTGELPQPVVAFLLSDGKIRPREALAECLRGLADEGLVRYETDPNGTAVVSLGADSPRSGRPLLPFEETALARVRSRVGRQVRVPFSALVSDDGDDYKNWWQRQRDGLGEQAQQAGLAVKSAPRGMWPFVIALIAASLCAFIVVHTIDWKAGDDMVKAVVPGDVVVLFVPMALRRWRLTPEGAAAVESWRQAGRGQAATDVAGPGSAPLPRGYAWSSLGGQWHTVRLADRVAPRPYWSTLSGLAKLLTWTVMGSFLSVMYGNVVDSFDTEGKLIAFAPGVLAAFVIATFWLPAYTQRMSQPDGVTFTGEVVKLRYVDGDDAADEYLAWIDDGSPTAMKLDVGPVRYHRLSLGGLVQVNWNPRLRCLIDIEPVR